MTDYKTIIKYLNEAKKNYLADELEPLTYINLALIELAKLDNQQEIEINQMGEELEGTLRGTINELKDLTLGEMGSK